MREVSSGHSLLSAKDQITAFHSASVSPSVELGYRDSPHSFEVLGDFLRALFHPNHLPRSDPACKELWAVVTR